MLAKILQHFRKPTPRCQRRIHGPRAPEFSEKLLLRCFPLGASKSRIDSRRSNATPLLADRCWPVNRNTHAKIRQPEISRTPPAPDFNIGRGGSDFFLELPPAPSHSNIKIWGGSFFCLFFVFRFLCGCCDSLANIRQKIEATSEFVRDFDFCMQQLNHPPLGQVGCVEATPARQILTKIRGRGGTRRTRWCCNILANTRRRNCFFYCFLANMFFFRRDHCSKRWRSLG